MDAQRRLEEGAFLVRLALGGMYLTHGLWKAFDLGLANLAAWLQSEGLPAALAAPLAVAEIAGGLAILFGVGGRWVNAALIPVLLGALWLHLPSGFIFSNEGGGYEYPLFLLLISAAHLLLGDGAHALGPRLIGRRPAPAALTSR